LNSDSGKPSFAGFKASKLSGITQTLFSTETKKDPGSGTTISWTAATTKDEATTTASEKVSRIILSIVGLVNTLFFFKANQKYNVCQVVFS